MKICLLGGSNSILKEGLKKGLCREGDLNLALGATTSLQNIYALASNNISECDAIVSESNVNDIQAITSGLYPIDLIKENIGNLYRELYRLNKIVVSIIIPLKTLAQQEEIIDDINNHHKSLCEKYGFYLIDLEHHFRDYPARDPETKSVIPEPPHPVCGFMYLLGLNLRSFLEGLDTYAAAPLFESQYSAVKLEGDCEKSNSVFQRKLRKFNGADLEIDIGNARLVGIETWSDDQSEIHIRSNQKLIVKQFGPNLSFNELLGNATGKISFSSNIGKSSGTTEASISAPSRAEIRHDVLVSGLLLKKFPEVKRKIKLGRKQAKSLSAIIPDEKIFISSMNHTLGAGFHSALAYAVDLLRDTAVKMESTDLKQSLQLMQVAHRLRPTGQFIISKIRQYESQLNALKNTTDYQA